MNCTASKVISTKLNSNKWSSHLSTDFQKIQYQLAQHLRDPENNPPPEGSEERRLKIYQRLFFNNINNFITQTFPVLKKLYENEAWLQLVRSFYSTYESHSPYFSDISKSFVDYLKTQRVMQAGDPPFLAELAHYEWVEFALSIAEDVALPEDLDMTADLLETFPFLSPHAWRLTYNWEVQKIGPDYQPSKPAVQATHIILCRRQNRSVHFILANPITHQLLNCVEKNPNYTGHKAIVETLKSAGIAESESAIQSGASLLKTLHEKEVLLGGTHTPV